MQILIHGSLEETVTGCWTLRTARDAKVLDGPSNCSVLRALDILTNLRPPPGCSRWKVVATNGPSVLLQRTEEAEEIFLYENFTAAPWSLITADGVHVEDVDAPTTAVSVRKIQANLSYRGWIPLGLEPSDGPGANPARARFACPMEVFLKENRK